MSFINKYSNFQTQETTLITLYLIIKMINFFVVISLIRVSHILPAVFQSNIQINRYNFYYAHKNALYEGWLSSIQWKSICTGLLMISWLLAFAPGPEPLQHLIFHRCQKCQNRTEEKYHWPLLIRMDKNEKSRSSLRVECTICHFAGGGTNEDTPRLTQKDKHLEQRKIRWDNRS